MAERERISTVLLNIPKGLHVLRYAGAKDMKRPPRVVVTGRPGASAGVQFLYAPEAQDDTLGRIGDCVAIRAPQPSVLLVTSIGQLHSISPDVELNLEPLDREKAPPQALPATIAPPPRVKPSGFFMIGGHVQRQGDVTQDPEGWLGAPDGKNRIESFAVSWVESVKGLRLSYACEMPGRGRHAARVPGQIVGTKGQATPITRVAFEITGSSAQDHELVVSASFLGAGTQTVAGTKIELSGPTGREPLTGLSINLRPASRDAVAKEGIAVPAHESLGLQGFKPASERGRVRVYRSSSITKAP